MRIFISETDRQNARRVALINIAKFYGISNWEYETNDALLEKINSTKTALSPLLNEYFLSYDDWFNFYQVIKAKEEQAGTEYFLNENEHTKLGELIQKRVKSLNALQKKFDELQLSKANKQYFGVDISGIVQTTVEELEVSRDEITMEYKKAPLKYTERDAQCINLKRAKESFQRGLDSVEKEMKRFNCNQ